MPLPEQVQFENLLQSMTPVRPDRAEEFTVEQIVPPALARDESGDLMDQECCVWYRTGPGLTFDALVTRVQKELEARGHKTDRALALCVVGFLSLHPRRGASAVATLNRLIGTIVDCDLSQFFVTPVICGGGVRTFRVGSFTVGAANLSTIEHRTKKAGSPDFFVRWHHELADRLTVERDVVACRSVGIPTLREETMTNIAGDAERLRIWDRCLTSYFHCLAGACTRDFWEAFLEAQHLLIAAGAPYMDDRVIRLLMPSQMISIFRNIEGCGFVAPVGQQFGILEVGHADTQIPAVVSDLRDKFGFTAFRETDIHHSLHAFALFVSKARRHELDGRAAEAFLHYVIALDLLFGEQEGSTSSVSRRTAIVVHRALNMTVTEAQKMINRLYDHRSKYVHKGIETPPGEIANVAKVCREILLTLLRLQSNAGEGKTIAGWLKNLDYLYSAEYAGKELSNEELQQCGIALGSSA